jgi:hypothetical protein
MKHLALVVLALLVLASSLPLIAQSETATVSGRVTDPQGAVVPSVELLVTNIDTDVSTSGKTNSAGIYVVTSLKPGRYRITVTKAGFQTINLSGIVLNVQDSLSKNFELKVGSVSEQVTVVADQQNVNTTDATVSTVVDRRFVENMPLNGRSFQTLITLTPGAVTTPTTFSEEGQFSVNGQRADANYYMVDGVSANIGTSSGSGLIQSIGGGLPGLSALGSTNTLVSVDAMQEFRIQTSTFAPEFGRTPGAQVSIVTRSGTNQFHGSLFDYFRNDILDAKDWFVNHNSLSKPKERQNDFGGVFGGPFLRDRSFFFFSYEGLRLRQPSTLATVVPDLAARQAAPSAIRSLLNAFPLPNGPEVGDSSAQFNSSFSNPASLDAYSFRLDQIINPKVTLFGRYDYAPSNLATRGAGNSLATVQSAPATTHTLTLGTTVALTHSLSNELRANYSYSRAGTVFTNDSFGGAIPLTASALSLPPGSTLDNSLFIDAFLNNGVFESLVGKNVTNAQRQLNIVDNVTWVAGSHQLKWGIDYRWLAPISSPLSYQQIALFSGLTGSSGAIAGQALGVFVAALAPSSFLSRNISAYGQDTWKVTPKLTMTYGLRWDVNPALKGKNKASMPIALQSVNDPSALSLAPSGSPLYQTSFSNISPRLGLAYQLRQKDHWSTILRGGFGLFFDLSTGSLGAISESAPFQAFKSAFNVSYPFTAAQIAPPLFSTSPPFSSQVVSTDPNLASPRTYQWNLAVEQEIGPHQSASITYVGAIGRDLLRQDTFASPNSSFPQNVVITRNAATSDYHSLQAKLQRQLSRGLQGLVSYTWSHSIDIASNDSSPLNTPVGIGANLDRGNSDFDVRHSLSGAVSYDLPTPIVKRMNSIVRILGSGWSIDDLVIARSALPVTVAGNSVVVSGTTFLPRPNVVSGVPLYLYGPQFPGGKAFNKAALVSAPAGTQGNLSRNMLRGFDAWQDDFTLRRKFHLNDALNLQFRAEFFNVFNHPNFGNPVSTLSSPTFGQSTQTLATNLSPGGVGGGFSSLYQIGGPRSVQLAVKITF